MISKLIIEMPRNKLLIKSYDKGGLISENLLLWLKSHKKEVPNHYPLGGYWIVLRIVI